MSFLSRADIQEKFLSTGAEVVARRPEQLAATLKADAIKWGKVIRDAGIRIE